MSASVRPGAQSYVLVRAARGRRTHAIGTAGADDRPLCRARRPAAGWVVSSAKLNCRACLLEVE